MNPVCPTNTRAVLAAAGHIRSLHPAAPALGIILGSGLGNFATQVENPTTLDYASIPGWPLSTVEGHSGKLVLGNIGGVSVAVMQGRVHAYEGYSLDEVTFPTRVLGLLGCTQLIVTNAAGGIDPSYGEGTLVCIADHINLTGMNAAAGPNEPRFGLRPATGFRFFDMTTAYSARLRKLAHVQAAALGIPLPDGVYLAVLGPSFETPAEIRAFRTLGADLVGMVPPCMRSSSPATWASRSSASRWSPIWPPASPATPSTTPMSWRSGRRIEAQFTRLLTAIIPKM